MAIVEMAKMTLVGLKKDRDYIMERLMELGVVHLADPGIDDAESLLKGYAVSEGKTENIRDIESDIDMVTSALEFLSGFDDRKKPLFPARKEISSEDYKNISHEKDKIMETVDEVVGIREGIQSLSKKQGKIRDTMDFLEPWRPLDMPLELKGTRRVSIIKGKMPAINDIIRIKAEFYAGINESYLEVINSDREQIYILLAVHKEHEHRAMQLVKKYGFVAEDFKGMEGTAGDNIETLSIELKRIEKEKDSITGKAQNFSNDIHSLEVMYDYLNALKDKEEALFDLASTERIIVLNGWVPEKVSGKVAEIIKGEFDCFVELEKPGNEEYPVLLENNDVAESVEMITEMYSLPNSKEVDPNAVMAPFFILFFGLMLSDAGYGLAMAIGSAVILKKFELKEKTSKFLKLVFYCGLATVFWGAMFGGWFGDVVNVITGGRTALQPLWFSPIDDPERLLMWSLAFGVFHIYVGISVRGYNLLRKKKYLDAVLDTLFWYILFTGAVFAVLPYVPSVDQEWASGFVNTGVKMIAAGAVLLILTQGRKQKSIIAKFFSGMGSLYDLIGFMSDVLSYSRLLALGLATSVIATIINQIGSMFGTNNILGLVLFVVVFAIGHTFNFLINALGAYVHSSRLQYIEFFGKFYEGGGKPFNPLRIKPKYIKIKTDKEEVTDGRLY